MTADRRQSVTKFLSGIAVLAGFFALLFFLIVLAKR